MTPRQLLDLAVGPALTLLPRRMTSDAARAMLVAIALQESRLAHRRQVNGPARGFWQFEAGGGVAGVLRHPATAAPIRTVLEALCYDATVATSYAAIEHQDVLAAAYARLLLFTLPAPLTGPGEAERAWIQYLDAWRPGRPHPETWNDCYALGWHAVGDGGAPGGAHGPSPL